MGSLDRGRKFQGFTQMDRRRQRNIPSRPLILIVADHDDICEIYAVSLSALGFEAITAGDCMEAGRRAWESRPDIVVTELTFRAGDGWQLIHDLRGEPRTRDIPIVVLTGSAAPAVRERAQHEGCAAFLVKPCLPDQLAVEVRRVLSGQSIHEGVPASG